MIVPVGFFVVQILVNIFTADQPMIDISATFEKHEDEFLKYDRIESPRHASPDLCAFLVLHDIVGGSRDMVSSAEHDEIWLDVDISELAEKATESDIITLIRCGVRLDEEVSALAMFV